MPGEKQAIRRCDNAISAEHGRRYGTVPAAGEIELFGVRFTIIADSPPLQLIIFMSRDLPSSTRPSHPPIRFGAVCASLPCGRHAIGGYLSTLAQAGVGGGIRWAVACDPPVPNSGDCDRRTVADRIVHGRPLTPEQRRASQDRCDGRGQSFATGRTNAATQPGGLSDSWAILDNGRLGRPGSVANSFIASRGRQFAHEIRTW